MEQKTVEQRTAEALSCLYAFTFFAAARLEQARSDFIGEVVVAARL